MAEWLDGKRKGTIMKRHHFLCLFVLYPLTLSESNRTEVIGLHDISLNRDVGVQNVATVTNACIIDEDIYMTMALQNVLSGPGNQSCVGEVKGDRAWSISLKKDKNLVRRQYDEHVYMVHDHTCMYTNKCENLHPHLSTRYSCQLINNLLESLLVPSAQD